MLRLKSFHLKSKLSSWPRTSYRPLTTTKFNKSHYDLLGVKPDATQKEIKAAYYDLAKKFHPDTTTSSSGQTQTKVKDKMSLVNDAYSILSCKDSRKDYDSNLKNSQEPSQSYTSSPYNPYHDRYEYDDDPFTYDYHHEHDERFNFDDFAYNYSSGQSNKKGYDPYSNFEYFDYDIYGNKNKFGSWFGQGKRSASSSSSTSNFSQHKKKPSTWYDYTFKRGGNFGTTGFDSKRNFNNDNFDTFEDAFRQNYRYDEYDDRDIDIEQNFYDDYDHEYDLYNRDFTNSHDFEDFSKSANFYDDFSFNHHDHDRHNHGSRNVNDDHHQQRDHHQYHQSSDHDDIYNLLDERFNNFYKKFYQKNGKTPKKSDVRKFVDKIEKELKSQGLDIDIDFEYLTKNLKPNSKKSKKRGSKNESHATKTKFNKDFYKKFNSGENYSHSSTRSDSYNFEKIMKNRKDDARQGYNFENESSYDYSSQGFDFDRRKKSSKHKKKGNVKGWSMDW